MTISTAKLFRFTKARQQPPKYPWEAVGVFKKKREKGKEELGLQKEIYSQAFSRVITPRFLASSRVTLTSAAL